MMKSRCLPVVVCVCVCVLAACQCSAVPGSAVRAGGPVQSHPAPPADSIQRQNPGTPAEPGHTAGRHLQPGQKKPTHRWFCWDTGVTLTRVPFRKRFLMDAGGHLLGDETPR